MPKSLTSLTIKQFFTKNTTNQKLFLTLTILLIFRLGNTIPLETIDQEAFQRSLSQFQTNSALFQLINLYSGSIGTSRLTAFSLGIIPFINASIFIDLLTTLVPSLEKLQQEEGEFGRKKLKFYKKVLTLIFAIGQSLLLISYLKPYFYDTSWLSYLSTISELVTGSLIIVWFTNIIDNYGIGNGTSILIFTNILSSINYQTLFTGNLTKSGLDIFLVFFLSFLICISQSSRVNVEVVSARQLSYLENLERNKLRLPNSQSILLKDTGLSIRLTQAGIFPIILAANFLPIFSAGMNFFHIDSKILNSILYYILIVGFNYFYTILFWDPEKISTQLRKASVSIVNVTPGKDTVNYLENVVKGASLAGGVMLACILLFYDILKQLIQSSLFNQLNISSLIILIGVAYEVQKTIRSLPD